MTKNKESLKQLDTELAHAGEATTLSPQMLLLEQLRITPESQLEPMDFLFELYGKPCFPRRELVAITGKAKSGKTFVTSMLIACCITQKVLAFKRHTDKDGHTESTDQEPLRVLWYDTEQSDESTQDILRNRIMKMIASEVFPLYADLVIVDGIRDLVNDINDGVLAQEVMEELMHMAAAKNCCIVCVLHQNKGSEDHNLRGWIGTELMNKAFEVYSCEKLLPQRIFKLEQTLTRKYDIEQAMYFEVNGEGLPVMTVNPPEDSNSRDSNGDFPQLNTDYISHDDKENWKVDVCRLFCDAIGGREQMTGAELRTEVCRLSNIRSWKFYNSLLEQAMNKGVLLKSYDQTNHVVYAVKPF